MAIEERSDVLFIHEGVEYPFSFFWGGNASPFSTGDKKLVRNHFSTDVASYSHADPEEIGLLISQYDFRKGIQDEYFEDQRRYAHAINCFAGNKGRVTLAFKKQSSVSFPAATTIQPSLKNVSFELDTFDEWTQTSGAAIMSVSSSVVRMQCDSDTSSYGRLDRNLWGLEGLGEGDEVTITCNAKGETGLNHAKLIVNDGVDETSDSAICNDAYDALSVTHTIAAGATQCLIRLEGYEESSNSKSADFKDVTITVPTPTGTTPVKLIEFSGNHVLASGSLLLKSTDGATYSAVAMFETSITDIREFDNYLWILLGASAVPWYTSDLSTFTQSSGYYGSTSETTLSDDITSADTELPVANRTVFSGDDVYAVIDPGEDTEEYILITDADEPDDPEGITATRGQLGSTEYAHLSGAVIRELTGLSGAIYLANSGNRQAVVADTTGRIRISTNPINNGVPLSSAYELDNDDMTITDLVDDPNGNAIVIKQDGPYYLNEDVTPHMAPELQSNWQTDYDYKGYVWKGSLFCPTGQNKLHKIDLSSLSILDVSIPTYAPGDEELDEEVQAMCGDADWLYVCIDNGGKKEILIGRTETIAGSTDWVWHPLFEFTEDTDIVSMLISNIGTYRRLYVLTGDISDGVLVFTIPENYSDPMKETGVEYESEGKFITGFYETEFFENDKFWNALKLTALNFDGKTSINVYYLLEGDGEWDDDDAWTWMGSCKTSDGYSLTASPRALDYPPPQVTVLSIGKRSRAIRFKFVLKTALDGSSTDEISPVILRWGVYGKVERSLDDESSDDPTVGVVLQLVESQIMRDGRLQVWDVAQQEEDLWTLKRLGEAVTLIGPDKKPRQVKWAQGEMSISLVKDEVMDRVMVARMILEEV